MRHRTRITSPRPLPQTLPRERGISTTLPSKSLNSTSLLADLAEQYNKNNDLGVIRSWFRSWRHNANEEHLEALLRRVNHVRAHTQNANEYLLELCTQQEQFEIERQRIIEAADNELEQQREVQYTFLTEQISRRRIAESEARLAELEVEQKKAEIDRIRKETEILENTSTADIETTKVQTEQLETQVELMKKVVRTIDLNELPDYLRTFVIASIFNPHQQITNEMQMMDELKDIIVAKEKAELKKMKKEAEIVKVQAQDEKSRAGYDDFIRKEEMKKPDV